MSAERERDLGALLVRFDDDRYETWASRLDPDDRRIADEARARSIAEQHQIGWRASPITMARHLEGDQFSAFRFQEYLGERFVAAVNGDSPLQTWNMPAQVGKSWAVRRCVAWALDRRPGDPFIYTSYSADLALNAARFVRDYGIQHAEQLRYRLRRDATKVGEWLTTEGGGLKAAPMRGGLSGFPAAGLVIDDPFKNWQEGYSIARQEEVWELFSAVLRLRMRMGGWIIVLHCIAVGEPVLTADGPRPVETIRQGDLVWSSTPEGMRLRRVMGTAAQGEDDLLEVATTRGSVKVNERHPFLVISQQARRWNPRWVKAGDLQVGDLVVRCAEVPNVGRAPVAAWDTPEAMWVLGYLFGDGWVNRRMRPSGGAPLFSVFCSMGVRDAENERVLDFLAGVYGRRPRLIAPQRYARLESVQAGNDLTVLGLTPGVGALHKRLPSWLFTAAPDLQAAFLDGLADADGHHTRGYGRMLAMANEGLVKDAVQLAGMCGVRATAARPYKQMVQAPHSTEPKLSVMWKTILTWPGPDDRGGDKRGNGLVRCTIPDGHRIDRIKAVNRAGRAVVYDLSVDGEENFIAGGFVVHNTRWNRGDLTGRIQDHARTTGEQWEHVVLPMIAETGDALGRAPGEVLEPARYDLAAALARARALGSILTSALEQQNPTAVEGTLLKRSWWLIEDTPPAAVDEVISSWDFKLKDVARKGDDIAGQVWARVGNHYWMLAAMHGQWSFRQAKIAVALTLVRYPQISRHYCENTGNGPEVMRDLRAGEAGFVLTDDDAGTLGIAEPERAAVEQVMQRGMPALLPNNPKHSKEVRVIAVSGTIESGHVHLVDGPETAFLVDQAANFKPGGGSQADDAVDAMSQALAILAGVPGTTSVTSTAGSALPKPAAGRGVPSTRTAASRTVGPRLPRQR